MNEMERKAFWNTLCSLKSNDKFPENIIKYPKYLYRYRSLTIKSLEDVKSNKLSFSTSNYYDDPFDTFLRIDKNELLRSIDEFFQQNDVIRKIEFIYGKIGMRFNENEINKKMESFNTNDFCNKIVKLIKRVIRNTLRSYTLSACFSENGLNETLWIKYANQHKGFVLIYDMEDEANYLCGKQEKCHNCVIKDSNTSLYPIYYSDEPYDATEYAKWFTASLLLRQFTSNETRDDIIFNLFPRMEWEREKITLIKKKCHMYDQEWRMISSIWHNKPITMGWKPYGIILGLNMSNDEKSLVYSNAKLAGIENIFECYINDLDELSYRNLKKIDLWKE